MRSVWRRGLPALLTVAMLATLLVAPAAAVDQPEVPVLADDGGSFTYQGKSVTLGPKAIYVDGRLTDAEAAKFDYVFNTFNEAVEHLTDGTEAEPMNLYLAPYVYWIHDPQAPEATDMKGTNQMEIKCENLHITGLTEDPQNVVVAANFGHDVGFFNGNYTMFYIEGNGLTLKDMTFGDYCNVDLVYPADPSLNVPARAPGNITQGQIGWYGGDKLFAENVRFISRLNMMPFNNDKRALYVNCHMECTDDALNGSAVYLGCDFEFYSSKPWYSSANGVTLLDCTMKVIPKTADAQTLTQYLAKAASPFVVIDSSFISDVPSTTIGWSDLFDDIYKSYYANVDLNGTPITFSGGSRPDAGVDLTGKDALKAFKLADGTYNVYNLLRGEDDWDPLGQKDTVIAAGAADLPTSMDAYTYTIAGEPAGPFPTMESGGENGVLELWTWINGPQEKTDYNADANVTWSVKEADKQYVELTQDAEGVWTAKGINTTEEAALVVVTARDTSGLEGAVALTVRPNILPAPTFDQVPAIVQKDGNASVTYTYTPDSIGDRPDNARIAWYVCDDAQGTNPVKIAVGRADTPLDTIALTQGMAGKHLMAAVEPKHRRSDYGAAVTTISTEAVDAQGIPVFDGKLKVDIATFPVDTQSQVIPGLWTVDSYKPADAGPDGAFSGGDWKTDGGSRWAYGTGVKNGVKDITGIYNTNRGARLMYTPVDKLDGKMDLTVTLAPGKTAGQGFGSAKQYMDFMVKYDLANHTGWGLRIYREGGASCCFALVSHTADGECKLLTEPVESSMFLTMVTVHVWTLDEELRATVTSTNTDPAKNPGPIEFSASVPGLSAVTEGGVELNHTGTAGDNAIYITGIDVQWSDWSSTPLPPVEVDKTALNAAVTKAEEDIKDIYVVADDTKVTEVEKDVKFITETDKAAYDKTVTDAKKVQARANATEAEVKAAVDALAEAANLIQTGAKSTGTTTRPSTSRPSTSNPSGNQADKTDTVKNPDGSEVAIKTGANGDKTITVKDADGEPLAEVKLPAVIPAPKTKFVDVPEGHWAEQSINNMATLGMVKGVKEDTYDMVSPVTRGSIATIFFRLSNGKGELKSEFTDVLDGAWYADGVAWASKVGVVNGYDNGAFGPDDTITRQQLAVMIARYARLLGVDTSADVSELSAFDDEAAADGWAVDSLAWCVKNGVMKGRGGAVLDPTAAVTRAEATTMLDRVVAVIRRY